ncbi:MAG: hypothetical protein ACRC7J_08100 [Vibrio ordalii]|jgi:hypothetical protein|uniref:hypothetical protein n=1 Tax=Vibrio ordalii TaxID=28174 RepID=UPI003F3675AC
MPNRITNHRYESLELRDKLASEYVLGTLPRRVQRRLETLMKNDPSWWGHVAEWQQHLSDLCPTTASVSTQIQWKKPPKKVWERIAISTQGSIRPKRQQNRWWLATYMLFSLLLGIMIHPFILPYLTPDVPIVQIRPVNYLAMMSSDTQKDHFALVAYQGEMPGQSNIRIQYNLRMDKVNLNDAMVWMRDRESQQLRPIDSLVNIHQTRYLSVDEWQALKNSSELLVTENRDPASSVLYRGYCVELAGWNSI